MLQCSSLPSLAVRREWERTARFEICVNVTLSKEKIWLAITDFCAEAATQNIFDRAVVVDRL